MVVVEKEIYSMMEYDEVLLELLSFLMNELIFVRCEFCFNLLHITSPGDKNTQKLENWSEAI
ncbi:1804_t:CDS:2 [Paraglomus brasilianum]|uniref:1804_t:CDS:1 n=1 Tax=Paraglomus brasilianum TaxID=144538 RepID=A0A9N9GHE5_9GLOM|nr:1804_t:CDS:2 [Paraglomus brasilianum]